ncbi:MAG TPA: Hsp20/alpha crystallin family protein [Desulfobulbaceae bacterium]|nr:Hsp20/alpha crystallin family protein [Desulfobulbaceae bacterium]
MALIRFAERPHFRNPWAEFERIRQGLDELSQNLVSEGKSHMQATVYPPLNMYETKDALILKAELPGVKAEDLEISVEGDTLSMQGTRKRNQAKENISYHRREIETGNFSRALALPTKIDLDNIMAGLSNGILTITLQKADEVKPRQVKITTDH